MRSHDTSGSAGARGAWAASGLTFFIIGVAFTFALPDNFALGITFLGLGVVFFSLSATQRAKGDGPGGTSGGDGGDAGDADRADASRDGDDSDASRDGDDSAAASPEDPPQR